MPKPLELAQLKPAQAELWRRLEDATATNASAASRIADLRTFLETEPDAQFAALVHSRRATLLRETDARLAGERFQVVINQFPRSLGETGVSLPALARLQLAEMSLTASEGKLTGLRVTAGPTQFQCSGRAERADADDLQPSG